MSMFRWVVGRAGLVLILFVTIPEGARPAQAGDAVAPEMEASIRQLLHLTGATELATQAMNQVLGPMKEAMPTVPEEFWSRFMARVKPEELTRLYVPLYARHFTHEDIRGMIAFYRSPLGRKVLAELPLVMRESIAVGQDWGRKVGEEVAAELRAEGYIKP